MDWNVWDSDDADLGVEMRDAGVYSYDLETNTPSSPVVYTPAEAGGGSLWDKLTGGVNKATNAVAWDRVLDKGLNFMLARDQLDAQRQLLMAGRTVGYNPAMLGQPYGYGQQPLQLPQLLVLGGLVWLVMHAAKS